MATVHENSGFDRWLDASAETRFWGAFDARDAARAMRDASEEARLVRSKLKFAPLGEKRSGLGLEVGGEIRPLTAWGFETAARMAKAPIPYLREMGAERAARNLTEDYRGAQGECVALTRSGNWSEVAGLTSDTYARLWNAEILDQVCAVIEGGTWRTPPARPSPKNENDPRARKAKKEDIPPNAIDIGLSVKVGDPIAPAGAYVSDRDMWLLLVRSDRVAKSPNGRALMEGVIVQNSEVGAGAFSASRFRLDAICGNHIFWGFRDLQSWSWRHTSRTHLRDGLAQLVELLDETDFGGAAEGEAILEAAARFELGADRESALITIEELLGASKVKAAIPARTAQRGLDRSIARVEGETMGDQRYGSNPYTLDAWLGGLTEISQELPQRERVIVDRAAQQVAAAALAL